MMKCEHCVAVPPPSVQMHASGSMAGRVVLPCLFSIPSHTTESPTSPPLLPASPLTSTPGPQEELRVKWTKLEASGEHLVLVAQGGGVKVGQAYMGRVSVAPHPLSVGDASLHLVRLRASDAGLFRCQVTRGLEETQHTVRLSVTGEGNRRTLNTPRHLMPPVDSNLISCVFDTYETVVHIKYFPGSSSSGNPGSLSQIPHEL